MNLGVSREAPSTTTMATISDAHSLSARLVLLVRLALVVVPSLTIGAQTSLSVPHSPATVLVDGVLADSEWKTALRVPAGITTEAPFLVLHDGERLSIGIPLSAFALVTICLLRSDTVFVLHASGSLGTARYVNLNGDNNWTLISGFSWAQPHDDKARRQFWSKEHWLGSLMNPAGTAREYQVDLTTGPPERIALAVNPVMGLRELPWPFASNTGCRALDLTMGTAPPTIDFQASTWSQLRILPR